MERGGERFRLVSEFEPKGDQPEAIRALAEGARRGDRHQTLLGVTGSGKSFTIACVVEVLNRPTLVMAPNKTLAAQLYSEFKGLFPENAVEYFVSYYDYYQPEAYIPASDTYIEKDSSINDEIDKLRHSTTHSLLTRRDVLVVASVSAIYGLGAPETYGSMHAYVETGMQLDRDDFLRRLVDMLYERNDIDFHRGTFRVRGDVVEVLPQYEVERALRIEFFGDEVESIAEIDPLRGKVLGRPRRAMIYPASHYVATERVLGRAVQGIRGELQERLAGFRSTAGRPARRPTRSTTTFPRTGWWCSTRATSASARSAECTGAIGRARRRWWSTGGACLRPWTTGRCASKSGRSAPPSASTCPPRRRSTSWTAPRAWWWSRSSGPPG
jgi:excinuclease ABC subunit B